MQAYPLVHGGRLAAGRTLNRELPGGVAHGLERSAASCSSAAARPCRHPRRPQARFTATTPL
jgi:hypothetical protein